MAVNTRDKISVTTAREGFNWLDWGLVVLALIGIAISAYLSYTKLTATAIVCTADGSCDRVNASDWAYFPPQWGIPVAYLGLVGYLALLGLSIWRVRATTRVRNNLNLLLFVGALGGVLFSAYLTAMELWVIRAICWWCVGSAVTITLFLALTVINVWRGEEAL